MLPIYVDVFQIIFVNCKMICLKVVFAINQVHFFFPPSCKYTNERHGIVRCVDFDRTIPDQIVVLEDGISHLTP